MNGFLTINPNPGNDRTWTCDHWKAVHRYCRVLTQVLNQAMPCGEIENAYRDLMLYGTAFPHSANHLPDAGRKVITMANLYAEHAREILGLDGTYQMSCCEDLDPRKSDGRIKISMMVCPRLEDGRLAWPMAERKTKKTCMFTVAEHDAWCLGWEQRTGKCHRCSPTNPGQEWIGWSKDEGDKYRTCPRCGGTNKAPQ